MQLVFDKLLGKYLAHSHPETQVRLNPVGSSQRLTIQSNGTEIGRGKTLNFVSGATIAQNNKTDAIDITVTGGITQAAGDARYVLKAGDTMTGALGITVSSANALAVGRQGTTSPQLNVDSSVANVVTGFNIQGNAAGSGINLSVIGGNANETLSVDAKGAGGIFVGSISTGTINLASPTLVTLASATAFVVSASSVTNPAFKVDTSANTAVTGLRLKSQASGGGVSLLVLSTATNESLSITTKGTGSLTIQPGTDTTTAVQFFKADASTIVLNVDTTNARVGIGTAAPTEKLEVNGNVFVNGATPSRLYLLYDNSGGNDSIFIAGVTNGGLQLNSYPAANNPIRFLFNQVEAGRFHYFNTNPSTYGFSIGGVTPTGTFSLAGNQSAASWTTKGIQLEAVAATYTDTDTAGTRATGVAVSIAQPTFAGTNAVTITTASTLYIAGAPAQGTNMTITNAIALNVGGTAQFVASGNIAAGAQGNAAYFFDTSTTEMGLYIRDTGAKSTNRDTVIIDCQTTGQGSAVHIIDTNTNSSWSSLYISSARTIGAGVGAALYFIQTGTGNGIGIDNQSTGRVIAIDGRRGAQTLGIVRNTTSNTAGPNFTVNAGGATSAATDKAGGDLILASGIATGTGSAGIQFQTATAQASTNTTDNTPATTVQINGAGQITKYRNVTATGWGVPSIYGTGRSVAVTAAVTSVAAYTVGAADGSFIVSGNVLVTTATAHSFSIQCDYTDEGNTARTVTFNVQQLGGTLITSITNVTGAGPYEGVPLHIRAKASTSITIKTTGTFTTVTYNCEGNIMQIA